MKNTIKVFSFILLMLASMHTLYSQECGTDYNYDLYRKSHPEIQKEVYKFEHVEHYAPLRKKSDSVRIIPVVFRIIHEYGTENISKSTIENAIQRLNEDYRKMNADTSNIRTLFKPFAADCKIEFRLAKLDPNGHCTEGINRINSPATNYFNGNLKSLIWWDNTRYLNIWVVKNITIGNKASSSAYAQFPGPAGGPPETDGIVIRYNFLGLTAETLTHEIGHWLGLYHTFSYSNCHLLDGDHIDDTPSALAPSGFNSCASPINTCATYSLPYTSDPPDMVENYMDYADDNCQNLFTTGQKARMDASLSAYRSIIYSAANLAATGVDGSGPVDCAPIADFTSVKQIACAGTSFNFTDKSYNATNYSTRWTFEKANTPSSTLKNPVNIIWSNPGKYKVTLTDSNANGKHTTTKEITVLPQPANDKLPFASGFENQDLSVEGWTVTDQGLLKTWELSQDNKHGGNASLFIHHYSETIERLNYSFYSKPFNFSEAAKPTLSFYVAHADRNSSIKDALRLYVSTDCGATWQFKKNFTGTQLSGNVLPIDEDYFPKPSDWHLLEYDMSAFNGKENVQIKFESMGLFGNNIFIDDISVQEGSVGINNPYYLKNAYLKIVPNPVSDNAQVEFYLINPVEVNFEITNATGQVLLVSEIQKSDAGHAVLSLSDSRIRRLPPGFYYLTLSIDGSKQVLRFLK